jgi:hypothetical protein
MFQAESNAADIDSEDALITFCGDIGRDGALEDACVIEGNVDTPEMFYGPSDKCDNVLLAAYISPDE